MQLAQSPTFITVNICIFDHHCSSVQGGILLRFRLTLAQVLEGLTMIRLMCSRYPEDMARKEVLILDKREEGCLRLGIGMVKQEFGGGYEQDLGVTRQSSF